MRRGPVPRWWKWMAADSVEMEEQVGAEGPWGVLADMIGKIG